MSNPIGDIAPDRANDQRATDRMGDRPTESGAQSVGQMLRLRREQLGWSLPDVAVWLKIRLSYLEALEHGQLGRLPGNAYAMGFLRTYAGTLGLDADDLSRRFRSEVREVNRKPELSFPAPVPERGVPAGAIVLLGFLVIVGAYAGWYEFGPHERVQSHPIPPVPATLEPAPNRPSPSPQVATVMPPAAALPVPATAAAPATATTSAAPATTAVPTATVPATTTPTAPTGTSTAVTPAAPAPATALSPVPAPPTVPAAATPVPAPSAGTAATPSPTDAAAPTPTADGTTTAAPAAPTAAADTVVIRATAQSWVQIHQDGHVVIDRVLKPGDSVDVPAGGPATLTTGNAGGVSLSLGSVTTAPLGHVGAVRRNIPLDPAAIRDGSIAGTSGPAIPAGLPAQPASGVTATTPPAASATTGTTAPAAVPARRPAGHPARPRAAPAADDDESATERLNAEVVRSHTPH